MKKILLSLVLALGAFASQAAVSVTLEWDANPETNITEYILGYSLTGPTWPDIVEPPIPVPVLVNVIGTVTRGTFVGLTENTTYHFAVRAKNSFGQVGQWSEVVTFTTPIIPPTKPIRLRIFSTTP